jgi:hypothetical protein
LDDDEFGVSATYTPDGGVASTVQGIFDNGYSGVDVGAGAQVASTDPRFLCRSEDVSGVADGDTLVVSSVTYIIRTPMPDGTGFTELQLEEQES